jgi:NhaA family Na+:H+ antiporter
MRSPSRLRQFFSTETASGIVLMAMAVLALILANSPLAGAYFAALKFPIALPGFGLAMDLGHWIKDGLMTVFFLLVGLEIKRELLDGELSTLRRAALPLFGALGGMVIPALVFLFITQDQPELWRGWAVSSATDIAFAVGVLALLGQRIPASLKIFLLALAILDDLGAVLVIAFFYSGALNIAALIAVAALFAALLCMNRFKIQSLWPYMILGVALWYFMLQSGVHATLAGVLLAAAIPLPSAKRLEHAIHPYVVFAIMPIFALANAGVPVLGLALGDLLQPLTLGIGLGLFLGKQLGIFASAWAAIKLGIADKPAQSNWLQLYGVATLGGIGFTMSLFIGALAFTDAALLDQVKLGVLTGSLLSGVVGYGLLRLARPHA